MLMVSRTQALRLAVPVTDQDHISGPETAAVTLVEYADYECSYCGEAELTIEAVRKALADSLRFVFRNFPLVEAHPYALQAAAAAEAADLQGSFWPMHDMLFQNQQALDEGSLLDYAADLGLDIGRFGADVQSSVVLERIRRDIEGGTRSGVQGTPTFFINDLIYQGSWDYRSLLAALMAAAGESDR
jgi:protein-disulfide isomerase